MSKDVSKAYKPAPTGQKRDGKYWIEKPVFLLIKETFEPDGLKEFLNARRLAIAKEKGRKEENETETVKQANHVQVDELDDDSNMLVETFADELQMLLDEDEHSYRCNHTVVVHVDTHQAWSVKMDSG